MEVGLAALVRNTHSAETRTLCEQCGCEVRLVEMARHKFRICKGRPPADDPEARGKQVQILFLKTPYLHEQNLNFD
jgi:ssDNA-binding Zn-finger/Zn-ribbon topoisomerase 1